MPWLTEDQQLQDWFTYHTPSAEDILVYTQIHEAGLALVRVIVQHTPTGADQDAAIRKVREAVMTANAARDCSREGL